MKRNNLISISLMLSISLCNCNNNNTITSESTSYENSSFESDFSESNSSESIFSLPSEEKSDPKKSILDQESIEIAVNRKFNVRQHLLSEFANVLFIDIVEIQNDSIVDIESPDAMISIDINDNITGKKEGSTTIRIFIEGNEEDYYDVKVNILSAKEYYLKPLDSKTLINKSAIIFGDSISDNSVTEYTNKPEFWVDMLKSKLNMSNVYNYAKSGSTVGYSVSLNKRGPFDIYGTYKVLNAKEDIKKSDYAFIFFGANDFCVKENLGNKDDLNDNNYLNTESFIGSYYYLINNIYKHNPNIEIVCLSCSFSTWGFVGNYDEATNYAKSREELNLTIQSIALDNNATYINVFDLWNNSNINIYCPDGIHPQTDGYTKIINRLIGNI